MQQDRIVIKLYDVLHLRVKVYIKVAMVDSKIVFNIDSSILFINQVEGEDYNLLNVIVYHLVSLYEN